VKWTRCKAYNKERWKVKRLPKLSRHQGT
jgi:hypothetical protein